MGGNLHKEFNNFCYKPDLSVSGLGSALDSVLEENHENTILMLLIVFRDCCETN